jgi:Holliday junction resolvasome RuvABC endonuclease subunit
MKIPVVGFDPSMNAWGVARSWLDLTTGYLDTPELIVMEPTKICQKQVRVNSVDLDVADQLAEGALFYAKAAKIVFVEVPVGSQSASGMKAYGMCVGILGSLRAEGVQLVEVTATEVKMALAGNRNATKKQMIAAARDAYPEASFPSWHGKVTLLAEHAADAIGAIHAGVMTPVFQSLLKLYQ